MAQQSCINAALEPLRKYNLPTADKWWEHKVDKVLQMEDVKILWNFKIQTDKHLAHNIPASLWLKKSGYG